MNDSVERFRPLLNFIAEHEGTANQPASGYNTSLGYGMFTGGEQNLVEMTLAEIDDLQTRMLQHPENNFNSSALGRYQIVRRTLRDLKQQYAIPNSRLYLSTVQDQLAVWLIKRRGRSVSGLRNEWASLHNASAQEILNAYDAIGAARGDGRLYERRFINSETDGGVVELDAIVAGATAPVSNLDIANGSGRSSLSTARQYHFERVSGDTANLNRIIALYASEGWTLKSIAPVKNEFMVVLESESFEPLDIESDERADMGVFSPMLLDSGATANFVRLARADADESYLARFSEVVASWGLKHFRASEFLVLGGHHFGGDCKGLNTFAPEELWGNMKATARVLDLLREELGAAITLNSCYRSPDYNACLPNAASGSWHMKFYAVDFQCADGRGSVHWAKVLKGLRDAGEFRGGIGVYPTFVHVDTRGQNKHFGPWWNKVF